MAGVIPTYSGGPVTYPVTAKVVGGQLVEADGAGVKPATANALDVLGVAMTDALTAAEVTAITDAIGANVILGHSYPEHTTVAGPNHIIPVTYAANAAFGALLKAAANGTVTPWVAGTDAPERIVGRCAQPGGVTVSSNAVGLFRVGQ